MADSPRPLPVIEADIKVTRTALDVCESIVSALLFQRRWLLSIGFGDDQALCAELDNDAARWASRGEHQRQALRDLDNEWSRRRDQMPEVAS